VVAAIYAGYIGVLNLTYNLLWWVVVRQQRSAHRKGWRPPTSMIVSYLGFPCYVVAVRIAFWLEKEFSRRSVSDDIPTVSRTPRSGREDIHPRSTFRWIPFRPAYSTFEATSIG
jgi:hypothetical protein